MVRVRYTKNTETGLMTSPKILCGNDFYVVTINPTANSYAVTAFDTGTAVHQGTAKTLAGVKRAAKEQLAAMGVPFEDEVRTKRSADVSADLPKAVNG